MTLGIDDDDDDVGDDSVSLMERMMALVAAIRSLAWSKNAMNLGHEVEIFPEIK